MYYSWSYVLLFDSFRCPVSCDVPYPICLRVTNLPREKSTSAQLTLVLHRYWKLVDCSISRYRWIKKNAPLNDCSQLSHARQHLLVCWRQPRLRFDAAPRSAIDPASAPAHYLFPSSTSLTPSRILFHIAIRRSLHKTSRAISFERRRQLVDVANDVNQLISF